VQSSAAKAGIAALLVAAAVVLFVVLQDDGSGDEPGQTATTDGQPGAKKAAEPVILFRGGKVVGGVREIDVSSGDRVRFRVSADVSDEVHVHGFDIIEPVAPGRPASFAFPADIEGIFDVELEGQGVQIAQLTVNP